MNKFASLFVLLVVFWLTPLSAHPPKGLDLEYDAVEHMLYVKITHSVNDAAKHYITKIIVDLNGKKIIEQDFKSQYNNDEQEAVYMIIDAKEGDNIAVTGYCNISGKKKASLNVTAQEETEE